MSVLALFTRMRANEIAETSLENVHPAYIHIPEAKSDAGVRDVPLYPTIRPLVQHLKKVSKDGYLIQGLTRGGLDDKRAHYITKRLGRINRQVSVGKRVDGLVAEQIGKLVGH